MRVGLCQLNIIWENKSKTMEKVDHYLRYAKSRKAEILFFPEMTLTGFSMKVEVTEDQKAGDTIELFQKMCRKIGIAAGFGWVEGKTGEKAKNHYSIVNERGELLLDYVKIHPFGYGGEGKYFCGGKNLAVCDYKEHRVSVAICYDLRFPELFRIMDPLASLVVIPANWPAERKEHWNCLLKARAIENQVYVAGVNCVGIMNGSYYSGNSVIYNPKGREIARLNDKEGIILGDIKNDVITYREEFPVRRDQKIEIRKI